MHNSENSGMQFRLDRRSGVPVYRQLVDQVQQAIELGVMRRGDKLPTLSEVVGQLAINPNTVHRAYQELEREGVTQSRQGVGTFVIRSRSSVSPARRKALERQLARWVQSARKAGFDDGAMRALLSQAARESEDGGAQ